MSEPLTVYLAARYSRREELCEYRTDLEKRGHNVPARWLNGEHQVHGTEAARLVEQDGPVPVDQAVLFANDDVEDVRAADLIVCFTEPPRSGASRGGRHVEFGLAVGLRLNGAGPHIVTVGPVENVFHALDIVTARFDDWPGFLSHFDGLPSLHGWSRTGNERCDAHPWHKTNEYHANWYEQP